MSEPKIVKARLLDARYVREDKSILLVLECEQGRFRSQIHRDNIATYGNRTEDEIERELNKYVEIMIYAYKGKDKFINAVFDANLDDKIQDNCEIKYRT